MNLDSIKTPEQLADLLHSIQPQNRLWYETEEDFWARWRLKSPEETLAQRRGTKFDLVEVGRTFLSMLGFDCGTILVKMGRLVEPVLLYKGEEEKERPWNWLPTSCVGAIRRRRSPFEVVQRVTWRLRKMESRVCDGRRRRDGEKLRLLNVPEEQWLRPPLLSCPEKANNYLTWGWYEGIPAGSKLEDIIEVLRYRGMRYLPLPKK